MNPEQQPQGIPVNPTLIIQEYKAALSEATERNMMFNIYVQQLLTEIEGLKKEVEELKKPEGEE